MEKNSSPLSPFLYHQSTAAEFSQNRSNSFSGALLRFRHLNQTRSLVGKGSGRTADDFISLEELHDCVEDSNIAELFSLGFPVFSEEISLPLKAEGRDQDRAFSLPRHFEPVSESVQKTLPDPRPSVRLQACCFP